MNALQIEVWIGDVPKGSEVDVGKAYFMKLGELNMESNADNDYTARQLQTVEVLFVVFQVICMYSDYR